MPEADFSTLCPRPACFHHTSEAVGKGWVKSAPGDGGVHRDRGRSEATRVMDSLEVIGLGERSSCLSHGFSLEVELVGVMDEAVEDGVGEGGVADHGMPALHGKL